MSADLLWSRGWKSVRQTCQKQLRRKKSCQKGGAGKIVSAEKIVPKKWCGRKLKSTVKETGVVKKKLEEQLGGNYVASVVRRRRDVAAVLKAVKGYLQDEEWV